MNADLPPPPQASPTPEYDEKVHISKLPTGSISLEMVAHELKRQARLRLRRWISAGLIGVGGLGAGGGGLWNADRERARAERAEARAKKAAEIEARLRAIEQQLGIPPPQLGAP